MSETSGQHELATNDALAADLYLDLLKKSLIGTLSERSYRLVEPMGWQGAVYAPVRRILSVLPFVIARKSSAAIRSDGSDWPVDGETMVGDKRLENLRVCITNVITERVPGDLIEAGVWRGGASIFMRGVLKAHHETRRLVWVADSFRGLPKPNPGHFPADRGDRLHSVASLAVSIDQVKANFAKYGLLDDQVRFLPGWFSESLPNAPITTLAIMRLDGDMYESTIVSLRSLYSRLSVGGYAIVDDYFNERLPARKAVDDFRSEQNITDPIEQIDWTGAFWRRSS
jgi:O-methyltransferase